jgi:Domain of unknown function(DUF2779)
LLTKSSLLAFRQCPKRLWLETNKASVKIDSAFAKSNFATGNKLGELSRTLIDPKGRGYLVDIEKKGVAAAIEKTSAVISASSASNAQPVFEAGLSANNVTVFVDALLPVKRSGKLTWRLQEFKASTRVKDYHRDDIAIQAFVAKKAGLELASVGVSYINGQWTYPGGNQYDGLFTEQDFTDEVTQRGEEVGQWIDKASQILAGNEPKLTTGRHCNSPVVCGFIDYCQSTEPQTQYPMSLLPGSGSRAFKEYLSNHTVLTLQDMPDALLSERQLRVKTHTLNNTTFFDAKSAKQELSAYPLPAYFLDFETIQFAMPTWKSTRPYQQIPFQFSLHYVDKNRTVGHQSFLDLSGKDPSKAFAQALVEFCPNEGNSPVFVYNAAFEKSRISELASRYPAFRDDLLAIGERLVDLLKVAEKHYYHPDQKGSWSIKKVLPTIAPDLRYEALSGVQDGGMAMAAYLEAVNADCPAERKVELQAQLLKYCELDTLAMVRLWQFFSSSKITA